MLRPVSDKALAYRDRIVAGPIDGAILHLGTPAVLAALLQAGFLVVDAFWLGRVGPWALAAASTAGFVMWFAQALGEGVATGSGAVLSRAVGAADAAGARQASAAGLGLALAGSLLVAAGGLAVTTRIFVLMGTAPDVTEAGSTYLRIVLLGMPAYWAFCWVAATFRAAGDSRTPLRLLAVAAVLNLVVDPVLILGLGPFPRLEAAGAALATVGAWALAAAIGWARLGRLGLRPELPEVLRPSPATWRALRVGLPLGAEGALFSAIYILLTRVTTTFGTPAVAALAIGHKLEMLNFFVCAGMASAATTVVGQNLGAGQTLRATRGAWRTLFLTLIPVGAVTVVLVGMPARAVAVFSADPAVVGAGLTYVLLVGLSQPFMAAEVVLMGAFAGAHRTALPAAVQVSLTALRVPVAAWLVSRGWGVEAVWLAIAATCIAKGTILAGLFAIWQHRAAAAPTGR